MLEPGTDRQQDRLIGGQEDRLIELAADLAGRGADTESRAS